MNVAQPDHQSVPLLRGSEEQVAKLRKRLEEVFGNVSLAHDVVAICIELSEGNTGDFNPFVEWIRSIVPTPGQLYGWPDFITDWGLSGSYRSCAVREALYPPQLITIG